MAQALSPGFDIGELGHELFWASAFTLRSWRRTAAIFSMRSDTRSMSAFLLRAQRRQGRACKPDRESFQQQPPQFDTAPKRENGFPEGLKNESGSAAFSRMIRDQVVCENVAQPRPPDGELLIRVRGAGDRIRIGLVPSRTRSGEGGIGQARSPREDM